jgi:hypothetical protein
MLGYLSLCLIRCVRMPVSVPTSPCRGGSLFQLRVPHRSTPSGDLGVLPLQTLRPGTMGPFQRPLGFELQDSSSESLSANPPLVPAPCYSNGRRRNFHIRVMGGVSRSRLDEIMQRSAPIKHKLSYNTDASSQGWQITSRFGCSYRLNIQSSSARAINVRKTACGTTMHWAIGRAVALALCQPLLGISFYFHHTVHLS